MTEEWTKEKIKTAFDKFIKSHGRLPTTPEVDQSKTLPSSRQIQRKFGGLKALRAELGYNVTDFGSGDFRSQLARVHNQRGLDAEHSMEQTLIEKFGELFVHAEKLYGTGKNRVDFFVYTQDNNFGIDIFTSETLKDLQKNINIKIDKYIDFPKNIPLYFVLSSHKLTSEEIVNKAVSNMSKLVKLPNLKILTTEQLYAEVNKYSSISSPPFIPLHDNK